MTDAITPVFWWWILEEAAPGTFKIIDQYNSNEVYEHVNPHKEPGIWNNAARLQRACCIADSCVLSFEDMITGECLGWVQILLDEGYPRVSDCSCNMEDLVYEALSVSDGVSIGQISILDLEDSDPADIRTFMENNRDKW